MPPLRGGLVVRAAKQAKGGGARPAKPPAAPPAPSWPPAKAEPARRPGQPLLWATALSKSHDGERQQFSGLELALERGSVVAVVGPNGSGKSTLLSCLAGVGEPADEGGVQLRKGSRVAFLPQEPQFAPAATVLDAVLGSATSPAMVAVRAHAAALAAAAAGDASAAGALPDLTAALDAVPGGWTAEADVRAALERLGVAHLAGAAAGTLSGGQRKRAALAAALLSSGSDDVLVLDEPTNHLSVEGVEWLERRLAGPAAPPGQAVVLVTHDRAFMDAVATDVLELDGFGGWHRHPGSYAAFAAGREGRLAAAAAAAANAETLLRTEAAWMARQPQGRQAKQQARMGKGCGVVGKVTR